ncbi:MAG TPA: hypothetical protein VK870_04690 [Ignavibacteriaceae bacterium]|nr:hypothetical protein [Ignavibacteriaceae bacterium]
MLKFIFTLSTLLDSKSEVRIKYSPEMIISGLFNDKLTEMDWVLTLSELELVYGFEIPEELYDRTDLTLCEFAKELSQLQVISEETYPEFFDIKYTSMKLTKRYIELENKTDTDSVREMAEINKKFNELDSRLKGLLGNILVNVLF